MNWTQSELRLWHTMSPSVYTIRLIKIFDKLANFTYISKASATYIFFCSAVISICRKIERLVLFCFVVRDFIDFSEWESLSLGFVARFVSNILLSNNCSSTITHGLMES